jgi:hypothetical protein
MATKREKTEEAVNSEKRNLPQREAVQEDLSTISIRITNSDKRKLAAHFRQKWDVGFSTGVRFLLKEYMRRENLI